MYFSPYKYRLCIYTNTRSFSCMFVYILVQIMCILRTYIACTISRFYEHVLSKEESSTFRFEPMILCILASCLDHYAISVVVRCRIITVFVYFFIWSLVSYVWHRSRSAPRPCHDVASQRIDMYRFKAYAGCEAGLGGGNVAAHSGPIEEQPGAHDLKGGWLLFN